MRNKAVRPAAPREGLNVKDIVVYGLTAGAVLLGWQIAIQPLIQRAPVETAIRIAPASPLVLRRAAESELAAGRVENAASLSREALVRSPFDVRALRVLGLAEARAGREDEADEILTLAGNWSLRDDPAHSWLVERRLRRGDYASSFAHADTLVRRRQDIQPQVFRLFTAAGTADPQRSLPVLAGLLAVRPPWRVAYLSTLETPQELQLAANLGLLLEAGRAPLTNDELGQIYRDLAARRQFPILGALRERIGRPPPGKAVTNGGFAEATAPEPFKWRLYQKAGIVGEIAVDDLNPSNSAIRIDYDGYATGTIAEQLTSMPAGSYQFAARFRTETGNQAARLAWTVSCATDGGAISSFGAEASRSSQGAWTTMSGRFDVPKECSAQWLRLETRAGDSRSPTVVWFDNITISPIGRVN
ncbi:MAG: hypothetical protein PSV23_01875 [Brevundimonas sp.]|uniref:hypothetical protein n=1 Tax=Brevundimonas sp. TaxID=1871086 RepID=UPI00248A62F9|nr:hypothetical protein [Brevundimonas sp.]MDI1325525.1 hypothetical protein [Brevundimonas sp.]